MITKLPLRLEAWDAEIADNGWALDIIELLPWLKALHKEVEDKDWINAEKLITEFIDYLSK